MIQKDMRKLITVLLTLFMFFLLLSCEKKTVYQKLETNEIDTPEKESDLNEIRKMITIRKGRQILLRRPDQFVMISILFNLEQREWIEHLSSQTNRDLLDEDYITNYLSKNREKFFKDFGLTEREYIQYSINHFEEINEYLERHPEYQKAYEDTLQM